MSQWKKRHEASKSPAVGSLDRALAEREVALIRILWWVGPSAVRGEAYRSRFGAVLEDVSKPVA